MKYTLFALIFILSVRADEIAKGIESLGKGTVEERKQNIVALASRGPGTVDRIAKKYFIDIDKELGLLGNDSFKIRNAATQNLIKLGDLSTAPVTAHLKSTDDPEVADRCDRILEAINKNPQGTLSDRALIDIAQILANHDEAQIQPEIEFLIRILWRRKGVLEKVDDKLIERLVRLFRTGEAQADALEHAIGIVDDKKTFERLGEMLCAQDFRRGIEALKSQKERSKVSTLVDELVTRLHLRWDIPGTLTRVEALQPGEDSSFLKYLRNDPKLLSIYKKHTTVFLDSSSPAAHHVAVKLISDPVPHMKRLADLLCSYPDRRSASAVSNAVATWLSDEVLPNEFIADNCERFMRSHADFAASRAFDHAKNDPDKYRQTILDVAFGQESIIRSYATQFALSYFPEERDALLHARIIQIKQAKTPQNRTNQLRGFRAFRYKGDAFNSWWSDLMQEPAEGNNKYLPKDMVCLNIPPSLALKRLTTDHYMDEEAFEWLFNDVELRSDALDFAVKHMRRSEKTRDDAIPCLVRYLSAEELVTLLPEMIDRMARQYNLKHNFTHQAHRVSELRRRAHYPAIRNVLWKQLEGSNHANALVALASLTPKALADEKLGRLEAAVQHILREESDWDCRRSMLEYFLKSGFDIAPFKPYLIGLFEQKHAYIYSGFTLLGASSPDSLKMLFENLDKIHSRHRAQICRALLYQNPDAEEPLAVLLADLNGKRNVPIKAVIALDELGMLPDLPQSFFDDLYSRKDAFPYLGSSFRFDEKTAHKAAKAVIKNWPAYKRTRHTVSSAGLLRFPDIHNLLVPLLVKELNSEDDHLRWQVSRELTYSYHSLEPHLPLIEKALKSETNPNVIVNLFQIIAGIGQPASRMIETVGEKSVHLNVGEATYTHLVLGRISLEKDVRRKHLEELISVIVDPDTSSFVRARSLGLLGFFQEFTDRIHPLCREIILDSGSDRRSVQEAVRCLGRRNPMTPLAKETFLQILQEAQKADRAVELAGRADAVLEATLDNEDLSKSAQPHIEALPANLKTERYWEATLRLGMSR